MSRCRKVLAWFGALVAVAVAALAGLMSYESACPAPSTQAGSAGQMKAIIHRCYGSPQVLTFADVARPVPADDEVLVRVRAAAVNPLDWHYMRGQPYVMRLSSGFGKPKDVRTGVDFAGTVEAVGRNVTRFKVGDDVFGGRNGAFAQYLTVRESRAVAPKPASVTFEQAAAVPIAAITALQALRDKGQLQAGQKVLVNGASGGVGTYAVQLARHFGAEVTGVCSTRNVELVRSLGAQHVVDYTRDDFTQGAQRYDLIIDNVSNHPLRAYERVLAPHGSVVMIGGLSSDPWLGPMLRPLAALLLSPFLSHRFEFMLGDLNAADLRVLGDLLESGQLKSVIDRRYRLSEVPAAVAYVEQGHARGKVVVEVP